MGIPIRKYWHLLASYLKDQAGRVGLLALLLVATVGLQLVKPQFLRYFIDAARSAMPPTSRAAEQAQASAWARAWAWAPASARASPA